MLCGVARQGLNPLAIVDDLAAAYTASRDRILGDVTALLRGLADKKLVEV